MNDLPLIFNKVKAVLFADSSTLFLFGSDFNSIILYILQMLIKMFSTTSVLVINRLTRNLGKTYLFLFTDGKINKWIPLVLHNNIIKRTNIYKFIGDTRTYDQSFSWNHTLSNFVSSYRECLLFCISFKKNIMLKEVRKTFQHLHTPTLVLVCSSMVLLSHVLPLIRPHRKIIRILTHSFFLSLQSTFKK